MKKLILISIKPEFVDKIFNGSKSIELRKVAPNAQQGDKLIIYSTTPEKAIIGECEIDEVLKDSPDVIWSSFEKNVGIDKIRFNDYYKDYSNAVAIKLGNIKKFDSKITLSKIKSKFPSFSPPQTFKYFKENAQLSKFIYKTC